MFFPIPRPVTERRALERTAVIAMSIGWVAGVLSTVPSRAATFQVTDNRVDDPDDVADDAEDTDPAGSEPPWSSPTAFSPNQTSSGSPGPMTSPTASPEGRSSDVRASARAR